MNVDIWSTDYGYNNSPIVFSVNAMAYRIMPNKYMVFSMHTLHVFTNELSPIIEQPIDSIVLALRKLKAVLAEMIGENDSRMV